VREGTTDADLAILRPVRRRLGIRMRFTAVDSPVQPIFPEQLTGMRRANGSVSTAERVSGTILVAPPAYAFGLFGM